MLVLNARQVQGLLLVSALLFGLAAGGLAAQVAGRWLRTAPAVRAPLPVVAQPVEQNVDIGRIVRENIFDPAARGREATLGSAGTVAALPLSGLRLHGTVDGGRNPLALIEVAGKVGIYHPGDPLPGGASLAAVERNKVRLLQPDGSLAELVFVATAPAGRSPAAAGASTGGIRDLGGNRWQIAPAEVERARGNLNQLLKQARMEPYVVAGRTEGFVIRMIRPNTLLAQIGLRVGDVVHQVNGVELDSPEKALQILQQLREARRLNVALSRGGERLVFAYEVN